MRVVCQKCAAAFGVEDRWVGSRSVQARCPRCRHVQPVVVAAPPAAPPPAEPEAPSVAKRRQALERVVLGCVRCGRILDDALDLALGTCADCAQASANAEESGPMPAAALLRPAKPMRPPAVRPAQARRAPAGEVDREVTQEQPIPEALLRLPLEDTAPVVVPERDAPRLARRHYLAAAALALGVLGAGVGVLSWRDRPRAVEAPLPEVIQGIVERWRTEVGPVLAARADLLAEGVTLLAEDTPSGYRQARRVFQQALVLDPRSDEAVAGYGMAVALGDVPSSASVRLEEEALALVEAATARSSEDAGLGVARANLLLRKDTAASRATAEAVLEKALAHAKGLERAEALLARGRLLLPRSLPLASQSLDEALAMPEAPRRALYYRALAHEAAGEFRAALSLLRRRLSLDVAHRESLERLTLIYREVGRVGQAREAYARALSREPTNAGLRVSIAALDYQSRADVRGAVQSLRALSKDASLDVGVRVSALVHLGAAERMNGDLPAAREALGAALTMEPTDAAAHLQLLLLQLTEGAPSAARHLAALEGRLGATVEGVLEGRVALARGDTAGALRAFVRVAERDDRRLEAWIWAGAAAAAAGQRERAFDYLAHVTLADPLPVGSPPVASSELASTLRPGELLDGAEGHLAKLVAGDDDVAPRLYEGVVRLHQRDLVGAEVWLAQAAKIDEGNALAHALRAHLAAERGEVAWALGHAERAVSADRRSGIAQWARGAALLAAGRLEEAERALRQAQAFAPRLLGPELGLAEVEARRGATAQARARLVRVLTLAPSHPIAKRALYALEG